MPWPTPPSSAAARTSASECAGNAATSATEADDDEARGPTDWSRSAAPLRADHDLRGARREQHHRRDRALEREVRRVEQRPGVGRHDGQVEPGDRPRGGRGQREAGERRSGSRRGTSGRCIRHAPPPGRRASAGSASTPASTTPVTTSPTTKLVVRGAGAHSASVAADERAGRAAARLRERREQRGARHRAGGRELDERRRRRAARGADREPLDGARAAKSQRRAVARARTAPGRPSPPRGRPRRPAGARCRSESWPKTISDGQSTSW